MISIVIVDDHSLLRQGTRQILEQDGGFLVLGDAPDGEEGLLLVKNLLPDVLLLDLRLPGLGGVGVAQSVKDEGLLTKVVILSAFDEIDYVKAALSAGVSGYLLKTTPGTELISGIKAVMSGMVVIDPALSSQLVANSQGQNGGIGVGSLTRRERDVVRLVANGQSNKEIAQQLGISPRTVEGHLNHIFDKVGTSSRSGLVRVAIENDLDQPR